MPLEADSVLELFEAHPERWIQGTSFRNFLDMPCHPRYATKCDLCGAIDIVYGRQTIAFWWGMYERVSKVTGKLVHHFNDHPDRSFDEIMLIVRKCEI